MFDKRYIAVLAPAFIFVILAGCNDESTGKPNELLKVESMRCSLDFINGDGRLVAYSDGGTVNFVGWAADSNTNSTPPNLNVVLRDPEGNSFIFEGATRNNRPDVVKAFQQEGFLKSGFLIKADLTGLGNGTYGISLQMPTAKELIICKTKKVIVMK